MKKYSFTLLPLSLAVSLAVQAESLSTIEVTGDNLGAKNKTNVVTLADSAKSTAKDLRSALSAEPAINFGGGNGSTSQWVTIRGMGQDQIDIKVDNTYTDTTLFHHQSRFMFDPSLMKRINVYKGAGSASAGIGATSGSIEATTVDAKDLLKDREGFGGKITTGVNSNKGLTYGATLFGRADNVDILVSGNWKNQKDYKPGKGYQATDNSTHIHNSALNERGLLAKIGLDLTPEQRIVLSHRQEHSHGVRALREEFDFAQSYMTSRNGRLSKEQKEAGYQIYKFNGENYVVDRDGNFIPFTENNAPAYRITSENTTNLEWSGRNMGFITEAKANAYYKQIDRKEPNNDSSVKVKVFGANLNLDSAIGDNHMVKYGLNYRHQQSIPHELSEGLNNQRKADIGAYVEGIWGIANFTLTTGLRYDYFHFKAMDGKTASKGDINPSLGLIWQATDNLSFNTNLNYATRSPRLYEALLSSGKGRGGKNIISVDRNLKAEKARNVEIGFNYELTDSLSLNGSYFWQYVKNAIGYHQINDGLREIANTGEVRNQGYELGAAYKYAGLTVRAGIADSRPEVYGSVGDHTVFAVKTGRTYTAGVSYKFAQPDLEIGWKGRFVQKSIGSPSRGSSNTSDLERRSGYAVHDIFASWNVTPEFKVNVSVDNLFNKLYKSHSQRTGANGLPAAGRDFRLNMSYTF